MRKRIACFLTALIMGGLLACPAQAASSFSDVSASAPYAEAVSELAEMGIIGGYSDGTYRPNNSLTRTTAAIIICRIMNVEEEAKSMTQSPFSDVPLTHKGCGYIAMASELGIIGGYSDGTYRPSNPVTYAQFIKMLVCSIGYKDMAEAYGGYPNGYIRVADECGITANISANLSDTAPRSMVALLAYNTVCIG